MTSEMSQKGRLGEIKQLMGFFFKGKPELMAQRSEVKFLASKHELVESLIVYALSLLKQTWSSSSK